MYEVASWKKAFVENASANSLELCKIGDAVRQRDMVSVGERDDNFENWKSSDKINASS